MQFSESIRMAFASLRGNKLRAGLTLLSMAIGVFAIVGVASAVKTLEASLGEQLVTLGSNDFQIQKNSRMQFGHSRRVWGRQDITVRQGMELRRRLENKVQSVSLLVRRSGKIVKFEEEATNPSIQVLGTDENYSIFSGYTLKAGRMLSPGEVQAGSNVAVLGADVATDLGIREGDIGKTVSVGNFPYTVIGIIDPKGAAFGESQDNFVMMPITSAMKYFFSEWGTSITINVRALSEEMLSETKDEAVGIMRAIRHVQVEEENDFEIASQEDLSETLGGFSDFLSFFGLFCGAIALLAAGVGIMNIMLVSVKERTKEIGIRKAIGATRGDVMSQFIIEAITICQFGAAIGILLGVGVGLLLGISLDAPTVFPWSSIVVSSVICLVIGVIFGAYPARKASRLDPIEALRYE